MHPMHCLASIICSRMVSFISFFCTHSQPPCHSVIRMATVIHFVIWPEDSVDLKGMRMFGATGFDC